MLLFPVLIPLAGSVPLFLMKEDRSRRLLTAVLVILSAALAVLFAVSGAEEVLLLKISPRLYLRFGVDPLSVFFLVLISIVWCLVQFHAFGYMSHEGKESQFFGFYTLTFAMLLALSMAKNAVTLYMCFELMTLCSTPLVLHNGSEAARNGALKYLGYSTLGAALALMGFFLLSGCVRSLEFVAGGTAILPGKESLAITAWFLIVVGFGCKAGMVPLQLWLTEAHPVAPSPASAVLSGVITKGGVLAILRATFYLLGADFLAGSWAQEVLKWLAIITVFTGSMLALREKLLKKRLAYSTVSQVSYVLFGIFSLNTAGFTGAMLQVTFHSLAKDILFLTAGSVIFASHCTRVDQLSGIGRKMPVTMWCFAIAALSLIGIPPTGGFVSKWQLAMGALANGSGLDVFGVVVLMISALLTAFYLLPIVSAAFFPGKDATEAPGKEVGLSMLFPPVVFSAMILGLGMLPAGLSRWLAALAGSLV